MHPFTPFLERQPAVILDGGLATELEALGENLDDPLWSAKVLFERPERIRRVHLDYLMSGADCVASASYQATLEGFARRGFGREKAVRLLQLSVDLAIEARDDFWGEPSNRTGRLRPLVAASIGSYGAFLADGSEFRGDYGLSGADLIDFHRARLEVMSESGADLLAFETVPSRVEALALARLLDETSGPPAWLSFSCRDGRHISDGSPLREVASELERCERLVAVGVNCTPPQHITSLLRAAAGATTKLLVAYPNSGEDYDVVGKTWHPGTGGVEPVDACVEWRDVGAKVLGGCCRTGPLTIRDMRWRLMGA